MIGSFMLTIATFSNYKLNYVLNYDVTRWNVQRTFCIRSFFFLFNKLCVIDYCGILDEHYFIIFKYVLFLNLAFKFIFAIEKKNITF